MDSKTDNLSPESLPDWMRLAQRGFDWGLLLVLALSLIVSAPLLMRSELSQGNANENYIYRTQDYATAISEGWLYPRWSPHVLGGYGAPIPNFYAPAAPYAAAVLQILFTNSPVSAVRLLYVFAICIAGLGMYGLVMRRTDAATGILAAMLFVYNPYFSVTLPHVLGELPGMLVLALTPSLLWACDRVIRTNHAQNLLLVSVLSALFILTEPRGAAVAFVLTGGFAAWHGRENRERRWAWQLVGGLLLGCCISSFYWIPALLEQSAIQWQANGSAPQYHLTLTELVSPLRPFDPATMVPQPQFSMGLLGLTFALAGGLISLLYRQPYRFPLFFTLVGLAITGLGLLFAPSATDLMGPVMICAAVSGSTVVSLRLRVSMRPRRLLLPILMIMVWIGSTYTWTPPEATDAFGRADGAAQVQYEQQGYGIAVLPSGQALPSSLKNTTTPSRFLIDSYSGDTVNKLAPGQVTGQFRISPISHTTQGDEFQLTQASIPVKLQLLTAYFPGWRASMGEQRLGIQANAETGLIEVEIPTLSTNNGDLKVQLGTTPVRLGGWLISGTAAMILVILSWGRFRRTRRNVIENLHMLQLDEARLIAVPIGCFGLVALMVLLPTPLIDLRTPQYSGMQNAFATAIRSTAGLNLSAFRVTPQVYRASETMQFTLYWQTQRFLPQNYQTRIYLVNNMSGARWAETALRHPGYYPTKRWNTRQYVTDMYHIDLPSDIPVGHYQVHIEVYGCGQPCDRDERLTFYDARGQLLGDTLILPTLIAITP